MLARLPLRSKLILVVSVPLFVILGFAGFGIANRLGDLEGQRQFGHLRLPNAALGTVQEALEQEGVLTTWFVAAKTDPTVAGRLDRAREVTDRAARALDAAGREIGADDVSPATRRAWGRLGSALRDLDTLRGQADERAGLPQAFGERYAALTDEAIDVSARLARDVDDRQLSDSMLGIVDLRREQAATAREAMVVLPYLATGSSAQLADWTAAIGQQDAAAASFQERATSAERAAFARNRNAVTDDPFRAAAGSDPAAFPKVSLTPDQYYAAWQDRQDAFSSAIASVQRVVDETAAALEASALRAVLGYGLGVSALVLTVLVLAWIMIRSVNRSLHSLTEAARDVAENQLPHLVDTLQRGGDVSGSDPIPPLTVASKDEIGALAQAFNTIQETTVRVAEEQAALLRKGIGDLYVNLARRNQSLVDRQIALLDVLEARAEDPDQLGSLFELDHLATRMRRNAESLLVLSGAGQARQWSEAIPILDVVRAASGEIADFQRVSFVGFEGDVAVVGNAVADVTHILAELLENATAFSPPGTPVVVAGMLAERRFVVSITDEGIGMDDQRLAAANGLLQQPPPPGLSLSRTLGLHVVAHLANRYGVRVQLRRAATNGVTAIVALPATVLTRATPHEPVGRTAAPSAPAPPPSPQPLFSQPPVAQPPTPPTTVPYPAPATGTPFAPGPTVIEATVIEATVIEATVIEPVASTPDPPLSPAPPAPPTPSTPPAPSAPLVSDVGPREPVEVVGAPAPEPAGDGFEVAGEPVVELIVDPPDPQPAAPTAPTAPTAPAFSFPASEPEVVLDPEPTNSAWPEPEVVPPAYDPATTIPAAATPPPPLPNDPWSPPGSFAPDDGTHPAPSIGAEPGALPRRVPGGSPLGGNAAANGLPQRSPGRHLSHTPVPPPGPGAESDSRPRPERVHDLLTRHLRGIRDGRGADPAAGVGADRTDGEVRP